MIGTSLCFMSALSRRWGQYLSINSATCRRSVSSGPYKLTNRVAYWLSVRDEGIVFKIWHTLMMQVMPNFEMRSHSFWCWVRLSSARMLRISNEATDSYSALKADRDTFRRFALPAMSLNDGSIIENDHNWRYYVKFTPDISHLHIIWARFTTTLFH